MVEDSTVEIHHLARLMTVLPCSILVRPFLMKPALVLSPTFSRETQSVFFFSREGMLSLDLFRAVTRQRKQMRSVWPKEQIQGPQVDTTGRQKVFLYIELQSTSHSRSTHWAVVSSLTLQVCEQR